MKVRKSFYKVLWQEWQEEVCHIALARKKCKKKKSIRSIQAVRISMEGEISDSRVELASDTQITETACASIK